MITLTGKRTHKDDRLKRSLPNEFMNSWDVNKEVPCYFS